MSAAPSPFVPFLSKLRAAGFAVGVDTHLRVEALWRELPLGTPRAELADWLAPLLCGKPEEQVRFYALWPEVEPLLPPFTEPFFSKKINGPSESPKGEAPEATPPPPAPPRRRKYFLAALGLGLLLAGGIALLPRAYQHPPLVSGCRDTLALNHNPEANVDCDGCCVYAEQPNIAPDPGEQTDVSPPKPDPKPKPDPVADPPYKVPFPDRPAPPAPELSTAGSDPLRWMHRNRYALCGAASGLLLCLIGGLLWFRRDRRAYALRRLDEAGAPYVLSLALARKAPLLLESGFLQLANTLRGREDSGLLRLDLPGTVQATVANVGRLTLRHVAATRRTEYLLLVDRRHEQDHEAQLFESVYRRLHEGEVLVARYFYDTDPRWVYHEAQPEGLSLEALAYQYPAHRLLVLGDAHALLDPSGTGLREWAALMRPWRERALLTPVPTAAWSYREALLARLFLVLPTGLEGLLELSERFATGQPSDLRDWKYRRGADDRPLVIDEAQPVESLRAQGFDEAALRWLAACALFPSLHWELTLRQAEALGIVPSYAALRRLGRLEWFRRGALPEGVRQALQDAGLLSPEQQQTARAVLVQALEESRPLEHETSAAAQEHALHLAVNRLLAARLPEETRRCLREYRQLRATNALPEDPVAIAAVDRQHRLTGLPLPEGLRRTLFVEGRPVLGARRRALLVLPLLLIGLLWLGAWSWRGTCENPQWLEEKAYCVDSPADSLAFLLLQTQFFVKTGNPEALFELSRKGALLGGQEWQREVYAPKMLALLYQEKLRLYRAGDYAASQRLNKAMVFDSVAHRDALGALENDRPGLRRVPANDSLLKDLAHLDGLGFFYEGKRPLATAIRDGLLRLDALYFRRNAPNLHHLLLYDEVHAPVAARARVRKGARYGYLGPDGELVLPLQYTAAEDFSPDGLARVTLPGGKALLMDTTGKERIIGKLMPVQDPRSGKWGYQEVGRQTFVLAARFDAAGEFDPLKGTAEVRSGGYAYRIDRTGRCVAECPPPPGTVLPLPEKALGTVYFEFDYNRLTPQGKAVLDQVAQKLNQDPKQCLRYECYEPDAGTAAYKTELAIQKIAAINEYLTKEKGIAPARLNAERAVAPLNLSAYNRLARDSMRRIDLLSTTCMDIQANTETVNGVSFTMIPIKGGTFTMGCTEEQKDCWGNEMRTHPVTLSDYALGQTEVTQALWYAVMGSDPSEFDKCDECPVEQVSWEDAQQFITKLNAMTTRKYRLPTEAEWEYAARERGKQVLFGNGKNIADPAEMNFDARAEYFDTVHVMDVETFDELIKLVERELKKEYSVAGEYRGKTTPAKTFPANALGLYDMSGNVQEWCQDWYAGGYYKESPKENPRNDNIESDRVLRGGSWGDGPRNCRVACRYFGTPDDGITPDYRGGSIGFRLASQ